MTARSGRRAGDAGWIHLPPSSVRLGFATILTLVVTAGSADGDRKLADWHARRGSGATNAQMRSVRRFSRGIRRSACPRSDITHSAKRRSSRLTMSAPPSGAARACASPDGVCRDLVTLRTRPRSTPRAIGRRCALHGRRGTVVRTARHSGGGEAGAEYLVSRHAARSTMLAVAACRLFRAAPAYRKRALRSADSGLKFFRRSLRRNPWLKSAPHLCPS